MIERFVDYLQASLLLQESALIMKGFAPLPPVRFYKRGYMHPFGFRIYFGNPNSKKAMVIASGETMRSLRNDQYTDAEIIRWVIEKDGEISRLDLAVTEWIEDELVTIEEVEKWYVSGLVESSLCVGGGKKISSVFTDRKEVAETFYIGNISTRGRKGIFRAYDKGIEMGIGSEIVTRIELEIKREQAQVTAKKLAESNDIAGNFRARFNVRSKDFERLMDADAVDLSRGQAKEKTELEEKEQNRWIWLISQVAPALRDAVKKDRKKGKKDANLIAFLTEAGILADVDKLAAYLANKKYQDMLRRNELVPRTAEKDVF